MHDYRILVGAAGWQHAQWQGAFYPEGLPDEWRLGFYGNEFKVVLLPATQWPATSEDIRQLLQDSADSPVFLCELPVTRCNSDCMAENQQLFQAFGVRLLGVVVPIDGVGIMPELPGMLAQTYRVCIDAGPVTQHAKAILQNDARLGICWYGEDDGQVLQHGRLACVRIRSEVMTPRNLRRVLETLLAAQDPQRYLVVIFEGNPPSIEVMRQTLMLLDLV